jgi:uncharacterized protein (TIGR03083 family)
VGYRGDVAIAGVPGTAAPVVLAFTDTEGSATGALLPTGHVRDTIEGIDVTCVDNGMPVVLALADSFGLTGYELHQELAADAALLARIEAVPPDARSTFTSAMGPMTLGFAQFVGMRLNEHALHTWDIEVVADPAATIPEPVAALVVDNLELVARFTGKPTGDTSSITVATTGPERGFTVEVTPGGVALTPGTAAAAPDLELPAEAFARLVYGRLDAEHTPAGAHGSALDVLRRLFPGP